MNADNLLLLPEGALKMSRAIEQIAEEALSCQSAARALLADRLVESF